MKLIYKLFLALNSTILLLVIYLIKEHITLPISFFRCEHISCCKQYNMFGTFLLESISM